MFCLLFLHLTSACVGALPEVPSIHGHLTDYSDKLSQSTRELIDMRLGKFQDEFKVDFAVLIMGEQVEPLAEMADKVFSTWSIGKSWSGGGILLVVEPDFQSCRLVLSNDTPPIRKIPLERLQAQVEGALRSGPPGRALPLVVEKVRLKVAAETGPVTPPPFDPNPLDSTRGAKPYLKGLAALMVAAFVTRGLRKWS